MNRLALAIAAITATAYAWFQSKRGGDAGYTVQDLGAQEHGTITEQALPEVTPQQLPTVDTGRAARNRAAFLMTIRQAEGTAKAGGYGALFGWPAAGRSFDPMTVSGHPQRFFDYTDKAGKKLRTSAAGAYQITYTTWVGYQVPFRAWALLNGFNVQGFTPETQDAFALFLLYLDGALGDVEAGRLDSALSIAKRRWASLPGAGVNQPERSREYIIAAYQAAGGQLS